LERKATLILPNNFYLKVVKFNIPVFQEQIVYSKFRSALSADFVAAVVVVEANSFADLIDFGSF
jgi:hypothetical protein